MPGKPKLTTICTSCKREDVGVVLDWADRDANNRILERRFRMARHKVVFKAGDKSVPWCPNGRIVVPAELVFERVLV